MAYFLFCIADTKSHAHTNTHADTLTQRHYYIGCFVSVYWRVKWRFAEPVLSHPSVPSHLSVLSHLSVVSVLPHLSIVSLTHLSCLLVLLWVSHANCLLSFLIHQPCHMVLVLAANVWNNSKNFHQRYEQHILLLVNDNERHQSLTSVSETDIYCDGLEKYFKLGSLRLILKAQRGHVLSEAEAQHIHLDRAWHPTLSADHVAVACYLCHTEMVQADDD